MAADSQTVVILGAGINGCALARELALSGLSIVVVDIGDVACGTTSYSSRLIHGGLRYLEYGDFALVRESLAERGRLLRLAPQFVRPLELFVPIRTRASGVWTSALRFFGRSMPPAPHGRGLLLVWMGLVLYDAYARDPALPKHRLHDVITRDVSNRAVDLPPPVNPQEYRWLASYSDAQVTYPERLTLALLTDACAAAAEHGQSVRVLTYHQARLDGLRVVISPVDNLAAQLGSAPSDASGGDRPAMEPFEPAAVVNATGAWVDETLRRMNVPCGRLMGGTKGSHFITAHPGLAKALAGRAIYAEAHDGRPVFILPWAGQTLVGTTDENYSGDPGAAVASRKELDYLVDAVRNVFPQFALTAADIALSYAGVRPLPHSDAQTTAAISREHFLKRHPETAVPLYSIVGGKLTTCRALAEQTAGTLLAALGRKKLGDSRERVVPGGDAWPADPAAEKAALRQIANQAGLPLAAVEHCWQLVGTRAEEILGTAGATAEECIQGTQIPVALARWTIRHEWATRLDDLIERRLMLLYGQLTRATLQHLAQLLVSENRLPAADVDAEITRTIDRLGRHFGKAVS